MDAQVCHWDLVLGLEGGRVDQAVPRFYPHKQLSRMRESINPSRGHVREARDTGETAIS